MVIKDLNGEIIEIPNLQLALMQADDYRHIQRQDPSLAGLEAYLRDYWEDRYQKLLVLSQSPG